MFKPINANPMYEISDTGEVYSHYVSRLISPFTKKNGYISVSLQMGSKKPKYYIHRLVAEAFLGSTKNKEVDHINFDKADNSRSNLRIVSRSENGKHTFRNGRGNTSKLSSSDVADIRKKLTGTYGELSKLGREYGVAHSNIAAIRDGRTWTQ